MYVSRVSGLIIYRTYVEYVEVELSPLQYYSDPARQLDSSSSPASGNGWILMMGLIKLVTTPL